MAIGSNLLMTDIHAGREIKMTVGQLMLYGGIGLTGISVLGFVICIAVFSVRKKKMMDKLTNMY